MLDDFMLTSGIPFGISLDAVGGKVYWTERFDNSPGVIKRANIDGSEVETVIMTSGSPYAVAFLDEGPVTSDADPADEDGDGVVDEEDNELTSPGFPGDFFRGHRVSYIYFNGSEVMTNATLSDLLYERSQLNSYKVNQVMSNYDTAVYKFSIGKNPLDYDANLSVYRAADIHLYVAEIYARLNAMGVSNVYLGQAILNDGSYNEDITQLGVRGRVGFGDGDDGVDVGKTNYYLHNKYTNAIDSIVELTGKSLERRLLLEEEIMDERARELAFEGKRFYDLMRVAKRRNDPAYLADKVAAKFREPRRTEVREYLMNEENWYIRYFE
jgi:hypothetical protein